MIHRGHPRVGDRVAIRAGTLKGLRGLVVVSIGERLGVRVSVGSPVSFYRPTELRRV